MGLPIRILIIEDEPKTAAYLGKGLSEKGFVIDVARDGNDGLDLAAEWEYDLLIVDVLLPGRDGWSVLQELQRTGSRAIVLVLSALGRVDDKVRGLRLGADDYLVKPFAFSELLARIETILRRRPQIRTPNVIRIADLEVDLARCRVVRSGTRLDLTAKEFQLLSLLASRVGEVVSRTEITERVWDMNFDSDTNLVDVHIRRLRSKVDDPFPTRLIHTARGLGYVVEERSVAATAAN
jgi:two-component system copper resistance phosphate regulon response regulator CusR